MHDDILYTERQISAPDGFAGRETNSDASGAELVSLWYVAVGVCIQFYGLSLTESNAVAVPSSVVCQCHFVCMYILASWGHDLPYC